MVFFSFFFLWFLMSDSTLFFFFLLAKTTEEVSRVLVFPEKREEKEEEERKFFFKDVFSLLFSSPLFFTLFSLCAHENTSHRIFFRHTSTTHHKTLTEIASGT